MRRVKIKKIDLADEGLADMFNQMLGTGTVNVVIAYPRYLRCKDLCKSIIERFGSFRQLNCIEDYLPYLSKWMIDAVVSFPQVFPITLDELRMQTLDAPTKEHFSTVYKQMKESQMIRAFVVMCNELAPYKRHFVDAPNDKFINSISGVSWEPFPFEMNFKQLWPGFNAAQRKLFMASFKELYEKSYSLWQELGSPDIDIDQFVEIIVASIEKLRKIPRLSRCGRAFAKLRESVDMLKANFNTYYKDFIESQNPSIMMENFVADIIKNVEGDTELTFQFNTIIKYYKEISATRKNDPRTRALFEKASAVMSKLNADAPNLCARPTADELAEMINDI